MDISDLDERDVNFLRKLKRPHWWSADDYDDIPDDVRCEIFDGMLFGVRTGSFGHQRAVMDLCEMLAYSLDRTLIAPAVDLRIDDVLMRPDVLVIRERFDGRPVQASNAQLVVEVIECEKIERTRKMVAYAAAGIPAYVVVGGKQGERTAEIYRLVDEAYELVAFVPVGGRAAMTEPFPFVIDMGKINT